MSAPSPLAPYASRPEVSRGRLYAQPASPTRSGFQRDRDRIIHCGAFRRLKYKTQVFVYHEGDYYRTRLTHSIEVAQIARSLARTLDLNEDLAEAVALAHDLGHTPFGHAGEEALNSAMAPYGGFDHNEQTFRILTLLERRYAAFDGLNLTWETLEGTIKHNGPLTGPNAKGTGVPASIAAYDSRVDLELHSQSGPEAQVAAIADDIAYNTHDIDDGLRAGLFTTEDLAEVPLVGPVFREVLDAYPELEQSRLIYEAVRRLIDRMVNDCLAETRARLKKARPDSLEALRALPAPVVAISREMRQNDRALKAFLFERMYRHRRVNRMTARARKVVAALFERYLAEPGLLPREWQDQVEGTKVLAKARVVADYIAGMTDRYALEAHRKMFSTRDKK